MGFLRAMHLLQLAQRRPRKSDLKSRYRYESAGTVIHAKKCLTKAERAEVDAIGLELAHTTDEKRMRELLTEIAMKKIKFVPVKRAVLQDHSKYSGEKLRATYADRGISRKKR